MDINTIKPLTFTDTRGHTFVLEVRATLSGAWVAIQDRHADMPHVSLVMSDADVRRRLLNGSVVTVRDPVLGMDVEYRFSLAPV